MNGFSVFSIIALICYLCLFLAMSASRKDRLTRAFMLLLVAMMLWTGASFAMRSNVGPSIDFWYHLSFLGLMLIPGAYFYFFEELNGNTTSKVACFWTLVFIVIALINAMTSFFLAPPECLSTSSGIIYVYSSQPGTYLLMIPILACFSHMAYRVTISIRHHKERIRQLYPIWIGLGGLLAGNLCIVLDIAKGFPIDIISGIINAFFMVYVLYKKRLFHLHLLVNRSVCYFISAMISICLFSYIILPIDQFLHQYITDIHIYTMLLISILFTLSTVLIYVFIKKFFDHIFIRGDQQRSENLKSFSAQVTKILQLREIISAMETTIQETIPMPKIFIFIEANDGYCLFESENFIQHHSLCIEKQCPLISMLETDVEMLFYKDIYKEIDAYCLNKHKGNFLKNEKITSIIPIKEEHLIGLILLPNKLNNKLPSVEELNFLISIARIGAIAVQNSRLYDHAYREARIDQLTQLINRRYFYEIFEEAFHKQDNMSLALLSLDNVRLYNQLHGTVVCDQMIQQCATIMKQAVKDLGYVARMGGKEFAILLYTDDEIQVMTLLEDLRQQIEVAQIGKDNERLKRMTVSIGLCRYPEQADTKSQLEENAGQALYHAKRMGKNCVIAYNGQQASSNKTKEKEQIYAEYAPMIYALTAAIDTKDHYTFTHSEHVASYACALAHEIGWNEDEVEMIREAALLHDIGKIGISENILNKTGSLSKEEYEIIKSHVENATGIIQYLPSLDHVIPAVLTHHERYDGNGYPRQVKGEDIPMSGRILAIADSFDAMTSKRSYKEAQSLEYAIQELKHQAGRQFDPELVQTFVNMLEMGKIRIR